ncbi:MAG: fimbria/pilus outer membrane usher protein, partial [Hyphomonadaceae bacterium]|nr:fimbria/pilus outer membrane usher protein [Hyphomonadaceae bacterium]
MRDDLERLSIALPVNAGERVALADVPGLIFHEDAALQAIVLTCASACLSVQDLDAEIDAPRPLDRATGVYLNYDIDVQWLESQDIAASSIAEAVGFGRFGLIESSWVGVSEGEARGLTRLETRWTIDRPEDGVRIEFGDSSMFSAGGAPVRFAGVRIGRHFGLTPALITHPTAPLAGDAASASTVELYVDGALRARERVAAGPFAFDNAPLVTGSGQAQLVVTDVTGRQQVISRPFFVSTALLRPGLSDWALSLGAERLEFGVESFAYGEHFFSGHYRRGFTRFLTGEAALDVGDDGATAQAGISLAHFTFGQVRIAHARNGDGGASEFAWFQDSDAWSFGVQADMRDAAFEPLGRDDSDLRRSIAGNVHVDFGALGAAALTAASVEYYTQEDARTFAASYMPPLAQGSASLRLVYTESDERAFAFALTYSIALNRDVSASVGFDHDERGESYRIGAQRAPDNEGGLGWRARIVEGRRQYAEIAAQLRGRHGESAAQVARADGVL